MLPGITALETSDFCGIIGLKAGILGSLLVEKGAELKAKTEISACVRF